MGYAEEIAEANKARDRETRWNLRAAVREKYGMAPEKRKRGGIAGAWDRNKKVVSPVLQAALGLVNPALSAAAGGLIGGLDREGKSGIGFDVGRGAVGGIKGYGLGKVGQLLGAKAGIGSGVSAGGGTAAAATPASASAPPALNMASMEATMEPFEHAATAGGQLAGGAATTTGALRDRVMAALRSTGKFAKNNPEAVGMGLQGAAQMMAAQAGQGIARQQARSQADELAFAREQWEAEQAARRRRAAIADQLFRQMMGQINWSPTSPTQFG